jgi:hypothetical protein|tara:strand:+ start:71 stop:430 length:360 start_codon:yes stop_codon:yes gene_type:complete
MAVTYKWTINQMNTHIQAEGQDNVIYTVHWSYSGSEEISSKNYQASMIGAQSFSYSEGDSFTAYADTEVFQNIVIGWLEDALDVDTMKASLASQIQLQATPVSQDKYFTWNTPEVEVGE